MGQMHKNTVTGMANPATNVETVVYTTPAFQVGPGYNAVGIQGTVNITPGVGATAVVIRVRQGGLTGPVVGFAPSHTVAAGSPQSITFGATDVSTFLEQAGGGTYVVTVQQTGATGNGTTNMVDIQVEV